MSGRVRCCSSHQRIALENGWELGAAVPGAADPSRAPDTDRWSPASVPGTVASSLRASGQWDVDAPERRFDAEEWWYRTRFSAAPAAAGERLILGFDGLATFADVWLNGHPLLETDNMFVEYECDVTALLREDNELLVRCRSLDAFLQGRRPRPRWRTPMVTNQQLRWARTTLLGRTPGWSPPAAPVGPWRPVWLERRRSIEIGAHRLQASTDGERGNVRFSCAITPLPGLEVGAARLLLERDGRRFEAELRVREAPSAVEGELQVPAVELWWPHTHGDAALYSAALRLTLMDAVGAAHAVDIDLGAVAFRTLRLDREADGFSFFVNDRKIFCRGACWTPLDCISLQASGAEYDAAIRRVRDAGMNMLRVAGPFVYESDPFLERCDAAGILVWQDFMFANMDYPAADPAFAATVATELRQQLARLQGHPSLALLCGNSEGAQQAAMSGAGRECWTPAFFETELAAMAQAACEDVPYCPSSTHGGAFPFQAQSGTTAYYGVGAYLLPLSDARRSGLRFASECLAFANVPENTTLATLTGTLAPRVHHGRWKQRVPRDMGAGWDFDDVREHYLKLLYRVDGIELRYADHERYLRLSRTTSGEAMAAAMQEWRRARSGCGGALIWFLQDLWPGAGWGVIDSTGLPKAAYYYLKRVLQPQALFISNEETNGLMIHIANDAPAALQTRLELRQFKMSQPVGTVRSRMLELAAGSNVEIAATDLYEGFVDLSYAYRFGPAPYDLLHASLTCADGAPLAEAFHFPHGLPNGAAAEVGLTASVADSPDGGLRVLVQCRHFAQSVHVELPGFVADDQYFHMAPNSNRTLRLRAREGARSTDLEGTVHALNAASSSRISRST